MAPIVWIIRLIFLLRLALNMLYISDRNSNLQFYSCISQRDRKRENEQIHVTSGVFKLCVFSKSFANSWVDKLVIHAMWTSSR